MKLTCLAFQKKSDLDVKILNGGSRDLKYKMAAKFLCVRLCLPDDIKNTDLIGPGHLCKRRLNKWIL